MREKRDFPYWAVSRLFKRPFLTLMGVPSAVVAGFSPEQRQAIGHFIDGMNPASPRQAGVVFDHKREAPCPRIAGIHVPTLIIHARDDTLMPYRNAEFFSATIPGARLLSFPTGGHVVAFLKQEAIGSAVWQHLRDHAPEPHAQALATLAGESEEKHNGHEANDPAAAPVEFVAATHAAVDRAVAATTKARLVS